MYFNVENKIQHVLYDIKGKLTGMGFPFSIYTPRRDFLFDNVSETNYTFYKTEEVVKMTKYF